MRITEHSNALTERIDEASIPELIRQFGKADRQIFGSERWGNGLLDGSFLRKLNRLRAIINEVLDHPQGRVIFAGAGTSGRIALHTAATYGAIYDAERVVGLMAGGPDAFLEAKERAEDNPRSGVRDLDAVLVKDGSPFVYVGITCGLSAAYVAGQVQHAMSKNAAATAVIGFNPLWDASSRVFSGLTRDFRSILNELIQRERGILLNPIIGPEPVTGSTRLKGGTATKMILDCLMNPVDARQLLLQFEKFQKRFYERSAFLNPLIEKAAKSLLEDRSLIYLMGKRDGMMSVLDAAECTPTFGSPATRVRAYVEEAVGEYMPELNLTNRLFKDIEVRDGDSIFTFASEQSSNLRELEKELTAKGIGFDRLEMDPSLVTGLDTAATSLPQSFRDLYLKWTLNIISTGAFIQYGKVFGNEMIDLRISNLKLWDRACRIVSNIAGVDAYQAESALKAAVMGRRNKGMGKSVEDLIPLAFDQPRIVATAILMSKRGVSANRARALLAANPKLKDALGKSRLSA